MSNSVTSLSIAPDGKNIYFQLSSVIYKMPISTGNPKNILLIPNELSVSSVSKAGFLNAKFRSLSLRETFEPPKAA